MKTSEKLSNEEKRVKSTKANTIRIIGSFIAILTIASLLVPMSFASGWGVFCGNLTATAFYDKNSTSYFIDPAANNPNHVSAVFNGSVGIGTTSPSAKLDVDGTAHIRGSPSTTGLYVSSNGRVGIDTTDPKAWLDINDVGYNSKAFEMYYVPSTVYSFVIMNGNNSNSGVGWGSTIIGRNVESIGPNNRPVLAYTATGQNVGTAISLTSSEYANDGQIVFYTLKGNAGDELTPRVSILDDGNVGIGTTSPGSKLDIVGSGATDASIRIENSDTGGRSWWLSSGTPGVEASKFNIYDGTAGKSRLTIDSSGNVGIGTTTPATFLHIFGSHNAKIRLQSTATGDAAANYIEFYDNTSRQGYIGYGSTTDSVLSISNEVSDADLYLRTAGAGNVIISNGDVGIGTISPTYKLQVNAGSSSNPGIGVNGYIKATGSITANTGLDLAERFPAGAELPSAGELIAVGPNGTVVRTSSPYQANAIGVVSTKPGFALSGGYNSTNSVLVALSGRVPVRVSLENGPIKSGDLLTSSSTPGVAMKATKSGRVIGMALESFDGKNCTSSECFGTIRVFVNPHWIDYDNYSKLYERMNNLETEINELREELNELKNKSN